MAEGPKLLAEALAAGAGIDTVFVDPAAASAAHLALVERAAARGASVIEVAPGVLARAADTVTPQPVAAVAAMAHVPLGALAVQGLVVVCAGLSDPGNAGSIVRSAAASGASGVVFGAGGVDLYNPKAVRASAGAVFRLPVVAGLSAAEALAGLGAAGFVRLAAVVRGGADHDRIDWSRPSAVVVGSESHGVDADLGAYLDAAVTVPMDAGSESLNAAMAATVVCFEAARQRRLASIGTR